MTSPYKRRRPALLRNFWVYRYLIGAAVVVGLTLWFIVINGDPATVAFPFGLAHIKSTTGILMLLSALAGSLATALVMTLLLAVRKLRKGHDEVIDGEPTIPDDRPPTDYAAKTDEGFSNAPWTSR